MKIIAAPLLLVTSLAGCATQSDIAPYGKDTYVISSSDYWGVKSSAKLRVEAAKKANAHCQMMGKELKVESSTEHGTAFWTSTSSGLVFGCTDKPVAAK